ncbi:UNVERIFIED_CONTAM: hypothetical protein Slati_3933900 [Sesamum latifolium]|uniref:Retrovirus-related Pol polyprotein from transposon TNT 1-94 n=1 Tax=Sesamum latifolium TaxID=2727402 RepID=A0AAW2TP59_9LAMI
MHNANPIDTPMDKSCILSRELCPNTEEEKKRIAKIPYASVGSFIYAIMCTRQDRCFVVGMLSSYQSNPRLDHWLVRYSDVDGSAGRAERKSTLGYAFLLRVQEAFLLWRFLESLLILVHIDDVVVIYCGNIATIAYVKDPKYHRRTKHIDVRYHFIRDRIAQREVVLRHIPTDMIANPFTKPVHRDAF